MKGKKRQVLFTIDSTEMFQDKITIENKKLVCKYNLLPSC